jgi:(1->4)-alpha-D-glucan 1-alpha-D-glucosylmutase
VPDFYQGTELWDFSLVDPDNRRPVDYATRRAMLPKVAAATPSTLLRRWTDGRIKLFVTQKTLALRARKRELFLDGDYTPIRAGEHVTSFTRSLGDDRVLIAVPRLFTRLVKPGVLPLGDRAWSTAPPLPNPGGAWRNIYTGERLEGPSLALRDVFASFPIAVLERA